MSNAHLYLAQDEGQPKRIGKMPEKPVNIVAQYRESHHRIAQLVAAGCTPSMIRSQTGVNNRRLELLCADPTFQELIAGYTKRVVMKIELAQDAYLDTAVSNMLRAEQQIADHLDQSEESGELLPVNTLDKISQGRADRFGYSKHTKVEHTHDFASMLDKAIARSGKAKVIEHQPIQGDCGDGGATPPAGSTQPVVRGVVSSDGHPEAIETKMVEVQRSPASAPLPHSPQGEQATSGETLRPAPRSFAKVLEIKRRRIA
jgi:hypothetical protein